VSAQRDGITFPLAFLDRLRMDTDGAGVTALVGAWGCPLQCRLCINPKTWHEREDGKPPFTSVTPEQLLERVRIDHLYYTATGGGIAFGGGEPLLHTDFITSFRALCPPEWHIYAETCLHIPRQHVEAAAELVDWFFVDIKDMDPAVYRVYTGQDNGLVKENLALLLSLVGPDRVTVRVPHIPGFNTDSHVQASAAELYAMGVTKLDVFTYKDPAERGK
jgi:pyruvate formate lyase activating enzyme